MKVRFMATWLLLLIALLIPAFASAASAGSADPADPAVGIPLFFNGKQLKPEIAPRIINDVTMVPVRIIAEELGSKVEWNQDAQRVTITKHDNKIEMVIDRPSATVNGVKMKLDSAPLLIAGNTLLPVRFIAENMGIEVNWNDVSRAVYLTEKPAVKPDDPKKPNGQPDKPAADANGKPLPVIQTIDLSASQLVIKADSGELKPTSFTLRGPERIVIDIPNAVLDPKLYKDSASKSGETVSGSVYASKVRYSQYSVNPHSVRVVLDMKEQADLSWGSGLNTSSLTGVFRKSQYKVVIDPGHGDHDPGAKAANGQFEKQFNLSMGLKVYSLLQKEPQITPLLTRSDDTFIPLDDRAQFANDRNATLFVSIHGNSYLKTSTGTETYYYKEDSVTFAGIMHKHLVKATGLDDRGVRQQPFRVVKMTDMPAVLLEVGYLSNENEAALMFDENFQNKAAEAIVAGIKEQLNLKGPQK